MFRRCFLIVSALLTALASQSSLAADDTAYLRVAEESDDLIALEIASTTFKPAAGEDGERGEGPSITLVGVAHIGDRAYYKRLERHLSEFDVVLYESVMPSGAAGAGGETVSEQFRSTQASMGYVASLIETHKVDDGRYPLALDAAFEHVGNYDGRLATWGRRASVDAWGRPLVYEVTADGQTYRLVSLGADGEVGGDGANADISSDDAAVAKRIHAIDHEAESLQQDLARAIGLSFQLSSMDYDQKNFVCSDMAMDQLNDAMAEAGVEFTLAETLGGSNLPARLVKILLRTIEMADSLLDGAVGDTFKVVLIEMLGDESVMDMGMEQIGPAFGEIIIGARNQVVMEDLNALMADDDVENIAIFYGAGHMADFQERFADQLGYEPVDQKWMKAIEVDMTMSSVSKKQLTMIRMMMRRSLNQMKREMQKQR